MRRRTVLASLVLPVLAGALSACGGASGSTAGRPLPTLRLGYFANVTHASPLIGVEKGFYQGSLGATKLETQIFAAGGTAIGALLSGAVDATYVGPAPAINGFQKSRGAALRIVSGATANGASLVVRQGIDTPAQLKGRTIATPQTGATQDVAARTWLAAQGIGVDKQGAGPVTLVAQDNVTTLGEFKQGRLDGGWLPEPWASRLVLEGGAHELLDEASQWPGGSFVTTQLVVRTDLLRDHPDVVRHLLEAQVETDSWIAAHGPDSQAVANTALRRLTGKALRAEVIARAFSRLRLTEDPLAESLRTDAAHTVATGFQTSADVKGIYDLTLLRQVLGHDVSDGGLGSPA